MADMNGLLRCAALGDGDISMELAGPPVHWADGSLVAMVKLKEVMPPVESDVARIMSIMAELGDLQKLSTVRVILDRLAWQAKQGRKS